MPANVPNEQEIIDSIRSECLTRIKVILAGTSVLVRENEQEASIMLCTLQLQAYATCVIATRRKGEGG
jgi:hypothetical protein